MSEQEEYYEVWVIFGAVDDPSEPESYGFDTVDGLAGFKQGLSAALGDDDYELHDTEEQAWASYNEHQARQESEDADA